MKKILLLFCLVTLLSCSKEDTAPDDPIVAIWSHLKMIKTPLQGEPVVIEGNDCSKMETMTFKNNGKLEVDYYHYGENSECTINETASGIYDWKKVSEVLYNLSRGGNTGTTYEVSFPNMNTLHMTVQLSMANGQWQSYTYVYQKL